MHYEYYCPLVYTDAAGCFVVFSSSRSTSILWTSEVDLAVYRSLARPLPFQVKQLTYFL